MPLNYPISLANRVPAHRLILCATNDYFSTSFMSSMVDHNKFEITINEITGDILQIVIDCLYIGTADINDDNIEDLLSAASFLLCTQLQHRCTEYLSRPNVLTDSNCLGIWMAASRYNFVELKKHAADIVFANFQKVVSFDEFYQLNATEMLEILDSDDIWADSEEAVFTTLAKWIEFDLHGRKNDFLKLVQAVRLNELKEEVSQFTLHGVFLLSLS